MKWQQNRQSPSKISTGRGGGGDGCVMGGQVGVRSVTGGGDPETQVGSSASPVHGEYRLEDGGDDWGTGFLDSSTKSLSPWEPIGGHALCAAARDRLSGAAARGTDSLGLSIKSLSPCREGTVFRRKTCPLTSVRNPKGAWEGQAFRLRLPTIRVLVDGGCPGNRIQPWTMTGQGAGGGRGFPGRISVNR